MIIKMFYYDRIDVNKTSESKEYDICHYWYFLNNRFKFQPNVSKGYLRTVYLKYVERQKMLRSSFVGWRH